MEKAGILLRVSTLGQEDGHSLPDQERDCQEYCQKMEYQLEPQHIWNDGAQKSYTLNRPGLQAALTSIKSGDIQVLVVGRYDRFSRVQVQQAVAIYQIEELYGGRVESANPKEQFGRDSTGTLLRSVNAWRAEQELELIRDRTQGGRRSRAQSGKLIPAAYPLYGYCWADQNARRGKTTYILDLETSIIVERIYREIAAGVPLKKVARTFNEEHIPTPAQILVTKAIVSPDRFQTVGIWSGERIQRIASNPAYCGKYIAYRTKTSITHQRDNNGHMQIKSTTRVRSEEDPSRTILP